jgi:hypothetical protein
VKLGSRTTILKEQEIMAHPSQQQEPELHHKPEEEKVWYPSLAGEHPGKLPLKH